ncbi:transposase [Fragilaria crotonensis]|nr:transposase [Fragilaria crotonensis]
MNSDVVAAGFPAVDVDEYYIDVNPARADTVNDELAIHKEDNKSAQERRHPEQIIPVSSKTMRPAAQAGRPAAREAWQLFTDDFEPFKSKSSICMHCMTLINHHKKVSIAKSHLNRCRKFCYHMCGQPIAERPDWFMPNKKLGCSSSWRKLGAGGGQPYQQQYSESAASSSTPSPSSEVTRTSTSSCKSTGGQSSIRSFMLPAVTAAEKKAFQMHLAMHFFATGAAFQQVEEYHLAKAIAVLRPDSNLLPDRKKLATELLNTCYTDIKKGVDARMCKTTVCITSDGWSNVKGDPIVNCMATSPDFTYFLESVSTAGQQGHSAVWIAGDIERVITLHPNTTFAGAVTDNTSANRNAWAILSTKFPSMFFQGCCPHGLHLIVKDIFGASKTKKRGEAAATFPDGYPFEEMFDFVDGVKALVNFFIHHHQVKAQLMEAQQSAGVRALSRSAPTRWGTIQDMCQTVLDSERLIHAITAARDFVSGSTKQKADRMRLKDLVGNENFVGLLQKALALLSPIDALIVKYQADNVPISEVTPDSFAIVQAYYELERQGVISETECQYVKCRCRSRFEFLYGNAHGIAYLLDPRFLGSGLSTEKRRSIKDVVCTIPLTSNKDGISTDESKEAIFLQYTDFHISATREKALNSIRYKVLEKKSKSALQFGMSDGSTWPDLQQIAVKVFSMATSSAASERNFSTFGFLHAKARNRLATKSVEKLVFVKTNNMP